MMQILEAAGIPAFTDNKRQADESNRRGYYEHAKVASLMSNPDRSWITEAKGKAIKVVIPLLVSLPIKLRKPNSDSEPLHYRVLFMERDMEEILQSQDAMLLRLGKSAPTGERTGDISKPYRQQERHAKTWCARQGIHAMSVDYETLVQRPDHGVSRILSFLGGIADRLPAMRSCIDPALYHGRKSSLAPTTTSVAAEPQPVQALETVI
jgi:hypothetical protein